MFEISHINIASKLLEQMIERGQAEMSFSTVSTFSDSLSERIKIFEAVEFLTSMDGSKCRLVGDKICNNNGGRILIFKY